MAFVYLWYVKSTRKFYLGVHNGKDPHYTHSSSSSIEFQSIVPGSSKTLSERKDFLENMPKGISRKIIARGTNDEMFELEHKLLKNRYGRCWDRYYNESLGDPRYIDMSGKNNPMYGKTHTPEARRRVSEAQTGSGNSQSGTMWITDGNENKKIKKRDWIPTIFARDLILAGWYNSRKQHPNVPKFGDLNAGKPNRAPTSLGKHWYTDGKTEMLVFPETPLPSSFKRGRIVHPRMRRG